MDKINKTSTYDIGNNNKVIHHWSISEKEEHRI